MFRQALKYGTGLIALYLVVAHSSGMGTLFGNVSTGGSKIITTLQGR
ncbi:hypothetical protein [Cellulomonas sp. 73-145]|nr:hypothetical protein [Cellulomonas sp. 73-145]MBN9327987.1 hypothetical protein [Cellulomonas sp.]